MTKKYYNDLWKRIFEYFWDNPYKFEMAKIVYTKEATLKFVTPDDCKKFIEFMLNHDVKQRKSKDMYETTYFDFAADTVAELDIHLTLLGY